jgi:hypothetical protein
MSARIAGAVVHETRLESPPPRPSVRRGAHDIAIIAHDPAFSDRGRR